MKNMFRAAALGLSLLTTDAAPALSHPQDTSRQTTDNAYRTLQSFVKSRYYRNFQKNIIRAGHKSLESRQQVVVFADAIQSGHFDRDFKARVNLTACAGFAMLRLSKDMRLQRHHPFLQQSFKAVDSMSKATKGKSWEVNCRAVFFNYNL
ncbi:MAG: hypothetical protein COB76_02050 [Alphaproteobacteria bacterium]|nr:MAG: hypothetical protein COB76_02050 [Alphaproteobacteria bacterium]